MTECSRCGSRLPESGLSSLQPLHCPQCGAELVRSKSALDAARQLVRNYFNDVWLILTHPSAFFKRLPLQGGLSRPLAFALITHWIGSSLSYLWKLYIGGTLLKYADHLTHVMSDVVDVNYPGKGVGLLMARDRFVNWFTGAGPVLIDPFLTLVSILATSFFVFIGARLLTDPSPRASDGSRVEVTYESAARLVCFGMTPAILAGLPLFGGVVSSLCILIVTTVGAKEVYKVTTGRGLAIALFPKLLFLGIMGMGLVVVAWSVFKFFSALIS